jgi:uncharacterized protein YjbI with pentapeptide repeats
MEKKLQQFLDKTFTPYGDFPGRADVTQELLANLLEKFDDLKAQGKTEDEAYQEVVNSFGDVAEIMENLPHDEAKFKESPEPAPSIHDIMRDMKGWIKSKNFSSKFMHIQLAQADLSETDLTKEHFAASDLREASFKGSTLVGAKFIGVALKGADFTEANLTDSDFNGSDLQDAHFDGANLTGAKLRASSLSGAQFTGAIIKGTDFRYSDLTGISFDGQTLDGVIFDSSSLKKATFKNAKLNDVSFHHTAVKHAIFDGATMDKITYAILKGAKATLNDIKIQ